MFQISDASGLVKFWHYTSGKCLHTINEVRQTLNIAINPDGTRFLTTGDSPQIHIYDEETKKRINTLEPRYVKNHSSHVLYNGHRLYRKIRIGWCSAWIGYVDKGQTVSNWSYLVHDLIFLIEYVTHMYHIKFTGRTLYM